MRDFTVPERISRALAISSYDHSSISNSTSGARYLTGNRSSAAVTCRWISSVSSGTSAGGAVWRELACSRGRSRFHRFCRRDLGDHQVRGDPEQVRPQLLLRLVLARVAVQPDERILRHFLGPLPGADQVRQVIDQRVLVTIDDPAERLLVPAANALHQFIVCRPVHSQVRTHERGKGSGRDESAVGSRRSAVAEAGKGVAGWRSPADRRLPTADYLFASSNCLIRLTMSR